MKRRTAMKKRLILLLVVALVGIALACGLLTMNVKEPSTTEKSSTTTTTKVPDEEYSMDDSLTQRDIEFLATSPKIEEEGRHSVLGLGSIIQVTEMCIENGKTEYPLLWIENDFESAYFLCLYDSTWYRFDNCSYEDIPISFEGKKLKDIFFLCDSVIKRDLITGKNYDIPSTFYLNLAIINSDKYTGTDVINAYVFEEMLLYRSAIVVDEVANNSEHLFLTIYALDQKSWYVGDFRLHTDENGITYMHFWVDYGYYVDGKALAHDEVIQKKLMDCYDILLPYFERLEELEPESEEYQAIGIRIDIIEELLFRGEEPK